jgi:hypothetical protein
MRAKIVRFNQAKTNRAEHRAQTRAMADFRDKKIVRQPVRDGVRSRVHGCVPLEHPGTRAPCAFAPVPQGATAPHGTDGACDAGEHSREGNQKYTVTFVARPGVDGMLALRATLKAAKRHGLRCVRAEPVEPRP